MTRCGGRYATHFSPDQNWKQEQQQDQHKTTLEATIAVAPMIFLKLLSEQGLYVVVHSTFYKDYPVSSTVSSIIDNKGNG